jgi:hypothetical protein
MVHILALLIGGLIVGAILGLLHYISITHRRWVFPAFITVTLSLAAYMLGRAILQTWWGH